MKGACQHLTAECVPGKGLACTCGVVCGRHGHPFSKRHMQPWQQHRNIPLGSPGVLRQLLGWAWFQSLKHPGGEQQFGSSTDAPVCPAAHACAALAAATYTSSTNCHSVRPLQATLMLSLQPTQPDICSWVLPKLDLTWVSVCRQPSGGHPSAEPAAPEHFEHLQAGQRNAAQGGHRALPQVDAAVWF